MPGDKYTAVWISHTSINDYLKCPRSYYLKNVYKNPQSNKKIQIMTPALALGQAVHEVLESLTQIPTEQRFSESLVLKFDRVWEKYTGKQGGFSSVNDEYQFKERGKSMVRKIMENPGPLAKLAVKINQELPNYFISEEENIILCGKVDWLEYLKETDSVHIIDFKTGKRQEEEDSLQLLIYHLLVHHCQKRPATKASYWYLDTANEPEEKFLPELKEAHTKVLEIGRKIKLARKLEKFSCPKGAEGCIHCLPLERIIKGEGELVGSNEQRDIYVLERKEEKTEEDSIIL